MRRPLQTLVLAALAVAGLCGSALGVVQLLEAIEQSSGLDRLNREGWQIESGLEYRTQESRRAFLEALAVRDPLEQRRYADTAREAEERVRSAIGEAYTLPATPGVTRALHRFDRSWKAYGGVRDQVAAEALKGNIKGAMELDQKDGNPAFFRALRHLHGLKTALMEEARAQSAMVDRTLRLCIAALAVFVLSTFLFVYALIKAARGREAAALSLRESNRELEEARELDRIKLSILEMVGTHAPLSQSLAAVAELPCRYRSGAGAAVWSGNGDILLYQVSRGLPEQLTGLLRAQCFEMEGGKPLSRQVPEEELTAAAAEAGLQSMTLPLWNVAGDIIGLLMIFAPPNASNCGCDWICSQMVRLASLAIEHTLLYERLAFQAQHDILTGLPNRLLFQDRMQQALRQARRNRKKVAVVWLDLDRFKQINDSLGHLIGDEVLCEVARRLAAAIRDSDTAARIGGDEFAVLVSELDEADGAEVVAEKLLNAVRLPMRLARSHLRISASAGISLYPDHGTEPFGLMRNADLAMYKAKHAGRDAFRIFLPKFGHSRSRQIQIERELGNALEAGEFHLEYQPLVDRWGRLGGFEALLRWTNAKLGKVSPAEFIPIAEEIGLIPAIGEWVTRTACRDGASWLNAGMAVPRISVNASGLQLTGQGFTEMIRGALEDTGFPAARLEIEVTETALVGNLDLALEQIVWLRKLGVKFAIDDFGTGYSSLNQLRTLPVDFVKIDRSFIRDLRDSPRDSTTLVRGIIGLAHNLGLEVVAEGVETVDQLLLLRALGCDLIQGFFLHHPMNAAATEELIRRYAAPRPEARLEQAEPAQA
jgi:diguanylate cyclase (GGDEF)-like protein